MGFFGKLLKGAGSAVGPVSGALTGVAGGIFGGAAAARAARRVRRNIEDQRRRNQQWYDRRYNEDSTQRADAQQALTATLDAIRERNRAAAGRAAVMGGTAESVAAEKAANNDALSSTMSAINAQSAARKDNIETTYMNNDNAFVDALNNLELNRAGEVSKAIQGTASAGNSLATGLYGSEFATGSDIGSSTGSDTEKLQKS